MSSETGQTVFIFLFFVGFFAFTIAETYWLHKKKEVPLGRAFGFSFASNIFAITVGFFFSAVIFVAFVMMYRGDSVEVTPSVTTMLAASASSLIVPLAILVLIKWLLLRFLRITSVEGPFVYSLLASIVFFISVLVLPFLAEYIRAR